jgi:hypothetical protein
LRAQVKEWLQQAIMVQQRERKEDAKRQREHGSSIFSGKNLLPAVFSGPKGARRSGRGSGGGGELATHEEEEEVEATRPDAARLGLLASRSQHSSSVVSAAVATKQPVRGSGMVERRSF